MNRKLTESITFNNITKTTTYTYTSNGEIESITAPDRGITKYKYDIKGRVIETQYPDGSIAKTEHCIYGPSVHFNRAGQRTDFGYDTVSGSSDSLNGFLRLNIFTVIPGNQGIFKKFRQMSKDDRFFSFQS